LNQIDLSQKISLYQWYLPVISFVFLGETLMTFAVETKKNGRSRFHYPSAAAAAA